MKRNKVMFCGSFYMRKEYVQCLQDKGAHLFNNEGNCCFEKHGVPLDLRNRLDM